MKDEGLVLDVYKDIQILKLLWEILQLVIPVIPLQEKKKYNFQPFFAKNEYDQIILSIAHNGNLTNAKELKAELEAEGVVFRATSDSEVILRLIQKNLI
jgi:amidophosphoribosyltransferase